jgi:hypothetical protein
MAEKKHKAKEVVPEGKVLAAPTKNFFVTMLTRDIALMDAIMDLIDNCIDGVHREVKKNKSKNPNRYQYKGYYAEIKLSGNEFLLKDNCGGIPLDVAKHYAFRMGRSDEYHDDDKLETLGMYGIGMKRAIFKMGLQADVISWHEKHKFKVHIPENWVSLEEWLFDCNIIKNSDLKGILKQSGTAVRISRLHKEISRQFQDKSGFITDLRKALKNHYGYIIQQGFRITVNGVKIAGIELNILTSDSSEKNQKAIKPYVYSATVDNVDIEVMVGFYRPLATEEEIDNEMEGDFAASESENAGITVLCNDRVVLYCDKTFLTGWGETPVPKYHTQFIAIAGVVHFRSSDPIKLPVTTTKRGLDTSSQVYSISKNKIKEGLKMFTSFTNYWKKPSEERGLLFQSSKKINALQPGQSKSALVKLETTRRNDSGRYQIPTLPKPSQIVDAKMVTITFSREKQKIEEIQDYFFNGKKKSAAEVGGWCFDKIHSQVE